MKRTHKKLLLTATAIAVMGMGMASKSAMAFDTVNWEWNKLVEENVIKNVNVDIDVSPSGMVEIEKQQTFIGDVTADSTVTNITNNPPEGDGTAQPIPLNLTIDLEAEYDSNQPNNPVIGLTLNDPSGFTASNVSGFNDENNETLFLTFDLEDENPPEPIILGERDAIDLPKIESAATAVGNNQDIASSVSLELHDGQFLWGGYTETEDPQQAATNLSTLLGFTPDTGNTYTDGAAFLTFAGLLGMIEPSQISANSTVTGILNASVDSSATAVANNMSVELAAFTPDDALMIADVTQYAYADVSATSLVDDVTVDGYGNFSGAGMGPCGGCLEGEPQIPLVKSIATAVGNNFSVKVSSPEL